MSRPRRLREIPLTTIHRAPERVQTQAASEEVPRNAGRPRYWNSYIGTKKGSLTECCCNVRNQAVEAEVDTNLESNNPAPKKPKAKAKEKAPATKTARKSTEAHASVGEPPTGLDGKTRRKKAKKSSGSMTVYTPELATEICRRIAECQSMRTIAKDPAMPALRTLVAWQQDRPEFALMLDRAREARADARVEAISDLAIGSSPASSTPMPAGPRSKHCSGWPAAKIGGDGATNPRSPWRPGLRLSTRPKTRRLGRPPRSSLGGSTRCANRTNVATWTPTISTS